MTEYICDAEGNRVAKGSITAWGSCDTTANGFSATDTYVLGSSGEQLTDQPAANPQNWHTNVFAAGTLIATYDNLGWHFHLADWLGTRRAQTDYAGNVELLCASLPYGDDLTCTSPPGAPSAEDATTRHFTAKERDTESGLDYFGARYYGSTMGRWMSPDPGKISAAHLANPQKWNIINCAAIDPALKLSFRSRS